MTAETSTPIVSVRGEARLEVPPDRANVSVTVHASASSADAVGDQLARASTALRGVLDEHAAVIASASTSGLHVAPVFGRSGSKITGYRGTFSTAVEVADLEALSALVFVLTSLPNAQLDGPWWSLAPGHPAYREVRVAAIADARHRAEDYAAAVDLALGDLVEISDLDAGSWQPQMRMAKSFAADAESSPAFDFEPALQTVTGQVSVRYALRK